MGVMDEYIAKAEAEGYGTEGSAPALPARPLTAAEKVMALVALVKHVDDAQAAASYLARERNITIDPEALAALASGPEYEAIRDDYDRALDEALIREAREAAFVAGQVERDAVARVQKELANPKARLSEVAQSARAMADVKAKNLEKLQLLLGRPTSITETRDFDQIVGALIQKGALKVLGEEVVESSAEEVQDG